MSTLHDHLTELLRQSRLPTPVGFTYGDVVDVLMPGLERWAGDLVPKAARDECERQFQDAVAECGRLRDYAARQDEQHKARGRILGRLVALFGGGPDTPCRTVWRETDVLPVECVEVPMDDLRAAFGVEQGTVRDPDPYEVQVEPKTLPEPDPPAPYEAHWQDAADALRQNAEARWKQNMMARLDGAGVPLSDEARALIPRDGTPPSRA